ncbi:MAG TPA: hypothetical protein DEQ02_05545 [Ruminococcaceae bacterium]|nr:hypothetical protein [Oscillospiraceae bacterium]
MIASLKYIVFRLEGLDCTVFFHPLSKERIIFKNISGIKNYGQNKEEPLRRGEILQPPYFAFAPDSCWSGIPTGLFGRPLGCKQFLGLMVKL